ARGPSRSVARLLSRGHGHSAGEPWSKLPRKGTVSVSPRPSRSRGHALVLQPRLPIVPAARAASMAHARGAHSSHTHPAYGTGSSARAREQGGAARRSEAVAILTTCFSVAVW